MSPDICALTMLPLSTKARPEWEIWNVDIYIDIICGVAVAVENDSFKGEIWKWNRCRIRIVACGSAKAESPGGKSERENWSCDWIWEADAASGLKIKKKIEISFMD